MKRLFVPTTLAAAFAALFVVLATIEYAMSASRGVNPSEAFSFTARVGLAVAVTFWVHADCRRLRRTELLDQGFVVLFAWPLALPYHLTKTRGVKGLLAFAGIVVLFAAASYLIVFATMQSIPE